MVSRTKLSVVRESNSLVGFPLLLGRQAPYRSANNAFTKAQAIGIEPTFSAPFTAPEVEALTGYACKSIINLLNLPTNVKAILSYM